MEPIKIDDFMNYKFLSGIRHSPDGKHAFFTVCGCDPDATCYQTFLWVIDSETGDCRQLTSFGNEKNAVWLDNNSILFSGIRNNKNQKQEENGDAFTQIYKINIHGGESLPYTRIPMAATHMEVLDDDNLLYLSAYNTADSTCRTLDPDEKDYEILDELPFWSNNVGFINKKRNGLFLYDRKEQQTDLLTSQYMSVESYHLNRDKTKAVLIFSEYQDMKDIYNRLAVYDFRNHMFETISISSFDGVPAPESLHFEYGELLDENTLIFTASDCQHYGKNEDPKWYSLNIYTGEAICISGHFETSLRQTVSSDCRYGSSSAKQLFRNKVYFLTTEYHNTVLYSIDANGKVEPVIEAEGAVDGFSINDSGLLFIAFRENRLQEVYMLSDGREIQLTHFNDWVNTERAVVTPEYLKVETAPGVEIEGWIMKPANYQEGTSYPAILNIHGGPKIAYGSVFMHEMQYWANHGYAVFFCNPRGSDGRGNEFCDIRGKYGTIDYDDLMIFTDEVLKHCSFIDPNRIGVTGGSYGGFMTNWIIGHTDRFQAAVSQRSISNWISKFCTTDIGYFFVEDQQLSTPWSNYEKLWEHSPLKYADTVKTPTLFIHSLEDYRCLLPEGIQMFTALKYHGVDTRLCMFRGENHELSRSGKPRHRLRRLKEITDWFDRHLK